jgi:hypothetical protein
VRKFSGYNVVLPGFAAPCALTGISLSSRHVSAMEKCTGSDPYPASTARDTMVANDSSLKI